VGLDEFERICSESLTKRFRSDRVSSIETFEGPVANLPPIIPNHPPAAKDIDTMQSENLNSLNRRDVMKLAAAGVTSVSLSGWLNVLAQGAAARGLKTKSVVLLWMDGGPSHKDTFDLKPGTKDGGPYKAIQTSVPGIEISEHFPKFAEQMKHAAILRGMSTAEGAHGRAKYNMHTGYREGQGGVVYPSIGSIVAKELGNSEFALPSFVSIGNRSYGAGFLGTKYQPLVVNDAAKGVENLKPLVSGTAFDNRVDLLEQMEKAFHRDYNASAGDAHRTTNQRAVTLMKSKEAKAFDISQESSSVRKAYGETRFGEGCLLARRLIETGVSFVEVSLGGWDTHQNNFDRVKQLSQQVDPAMSSLVNDLKERGLLDSTLVIWMGEFGRTPKINTRGEKPGRDHYPRAWSSVMVGGGIKGGQVIGKTDAEGATVVDRKINAGDFLSTVCTVLGINFNKQYTTPNNRPVRIVDKGATPIKELIG
jgi:uncharacterized protein (DUF1501 family)